MSETDYILGLLAIISGLAISHMIMALSTLLRAGSRVRWDWLAALAAAHIGYLILYGWWVTWSGFHGMKGPIRFYYFLMPAVSIAFVVLAARTVLPDEVPEGGLDLAAHYARVSRYVWGAMFISLMIVTGGIIIRIGTGQNMSNATPWGLAGVAVNYALFASLAIFRGRAVQRILVPLSFALLVVATIAKPV